MNRRGWRWLMVIGMVIGMAPLAPLGVVADDIDLTDCQDESAFDDALVEAHKNGGGTITIICSGEIPISLRKEITGSVKIVAVGEVTLEGTGDTRSFTVSPGSTLELVGLTLQNGKVGTSQDGGVIYNDGGTVTVAYCTFEGNSAEFMGGAIFSDGGTVTVTDSHFNGNVAGMGGVIDSTAGTLFVSDSYFAGNIAGHSGGAISYDGTLSELIVTGSTFTDNHAETGDGGAINNNTLGPLTVTDSIFISNSANRFGGAIHNGNSLKLTVAASTFIGNSAIQGGAITSGGTFPIEVIASTFIDNRGGQSGGGAIFGASSLFRVTDSTFAGNSAEIHGGGAIRGGLALEITSSTFSGNHAGDHGGGAIFVTGKLQVTATTFSGNRAGDGGGGAIFADTATVTLQSTILTSSSPVTCVTRMGTITSSGYNLSDDDSCGLETEKGDIPGSTNINLGPLGDNGGPTQTMLPLDGSAAIDAIPREACEAHSSERDQRGLPRPQGPDARSARSNWQARCCAPTVRPGSSPERRPTGSARRRAIPCCCPRSSR